MKKSNKSPFEPFDGMNFSDDQCFLCGALLQDSTNSKEHVFPKWLLHRYNLWDKSITLLNRTSIPYRSLTIPCCSKCNNEYLSRLENEIETAINIGPSCVAKVDKIRLYQWVSKIFLGLLYRELFLSVDRSNPELGSITTPEFLQDYRTLHGFLQSIIKPIEFHEFFPGSLFTFKIETIPEIGNFDYSDNFIGMTFFLRMDNIGIIACLKDDEQVLESLSTLYKAIKEIRLHPIQFDELCATIFYKSFTMARNGKYVSLTSPANQTTIVKLPSMSLVPIFDEWDNRIFARFLEEFWAKWGITFEEIFIPPNSIRTYLGEYL
jgi:hypothetical protein